MIARTAIVYPHVKLGKDVIIEEGCLVGLPLKEGEAIETLIGDYAHIRAKTIIYAGNVIGPHFSTGNHVNIREHNRIGDHVSIGTSSVIEHHIVIEDGVRIHSSVFVPEYSLLETGCWLGPGVVLTNAKYPLSPDVKKELKGPRIGKFSKIGANATILPGVVVGDNVLVGAGSVVVKDVQEGVIVAGNPAQFLRDIHY
jgi:acetyltransferase-like isoleucine patch superfamily enzyme